MTLPIEYDHFRSILRLPAPSRAPRAFPRSLRPGIRLGIPARAPDVIYITFPGPPAHVQAPRSFPSPPSTQPVWNLSRGSRVHNACYPRVLTNCTTSQQASVTYRAPILAPLKTNPFPDSRPYNDPPRSRFRFRSTSSVRPRFRP